MGNVIDIRNRLKPYNSSENAKQQESAEVLDISQAREEMIQDERRQVKRTILSEFIGASVVVPQIGLMKVMLYDVSENGIAFDTPEQSGAFKKGEEIAMRVYLNHSTYFPFIVKVSNVRTIDEEGVVRHGTNFVKGTINNEALYHFIKFIETVSTSLVRDGGDILVSNLNT